MSIVLAQRSRRNGRDGFATILILVVVVVMSLAVYAFANQTYLEYAATKASIRQTQARQLALGGIDFVRGKCLNLSQNQRHEWLYRGSEDQFQIASQDSQEFEVQLFRNLSRFGGEAGLASESAKLNIHSLDLSKKGETLSRTRLCSLPNVTPQIADAILDWLDDDDVPRTYGAESSWYSENGSRTRPRNGTIAQWHELLFVRGLNEKLLFGEDVNGNGWLDWNENDGDAQLPNDNADNALDRGLMAYLSLDAFESNLDQAGLKKIDLNDPDLSRLFTLLSASFGEPVAKFVVAYRLDGPVIESKSVDKSSIQKTIRDTLDERIDAQLNPKGMIARKANQQKQNANIKAGGLSIQRTPVFQVRSLFDLFGISVVTVIDGEEHLLHSPWSIQGLDTHRVWTELDDKFTVSSSERLLGRIDINQASFEVLMSIPGMSRSIAESIVTSRERLRQSSVNASLSSPFWIMENHLVDLEMLRSLGPYLTTRGAIYSGYSAGRDWISGSSAIVKFTLSQSGPVVRLLEHREVGIAQLAGQGVRNVRDRKQ